MAYADQKMSGNRLIALIIVALIHIVLGYALVTGLAYEAAKKLIQRVTTVDMKEEVKKEVPPPKKLDLPPPPPVVAPPPKINVSSVPPPITTVSEPPPPRRRRRRSSCRRLRQRRRRPAFAGARREAEEPGPLGRAHPG